MSSAESELKFTRPTAIRAPVWSTHSTTSPRSKCPSTAFTPTGNKLRWFCFIASTAPSSITKRPAVCKCAANHCWCAVTRSLSVVNKVPSISPAISRASTCSLSPLAIRVGQPDLAAKRAARTFVTIPPRPNTPPPPAISNKRSSNARTEENSLALGLLRGSESNMPCWSVKIINNSAETCPATIAAKVSLSPKRISSVDTVSFSLMTGITRQSMRFCKASQEFK